MRHVRGGLGRGLDALIPRPVVGIQEIDADRVAPNPTQPRQTFDAAALEELAASIRQHGVLQPIIVSRQGADYTLIAGERRWRAARMAGMSTITAIVRDAAPADSLEIALVENVQRADLTALEEAAAYRALMEDHGLTQAEVADRVGRSRSAVANRLRLLALPTGTQSLLAQGRLTEGHARALLGCDDAVLLNALAERVAGAQLSVRQTEELVRRSATRRPAPSEGTVTEDPGHGQTDRERAELASMEQELQQVLGTRVQLVRSRRGGRVIIHYYDDDQLTGLVDAILGRGEF